MCNFSTQRCSLTSVILHTLAFRLLPLLRHRFVVVLTKTDFLCVRQIRAVQHFLAHLDRTLKKGGTEADKKTWLFCAQPTLRDSGPKQSVLPDFSWCNIPNREK
jgi:hypothetical protein